MVDYVSVASVGANLNEPPQTAEIFPPQFSDDQFLVVNPVTYTQSHDLLLVVTFTPSPSSSLWVLLPVPSVL